MAPGSPAAPGQDQAGTHRTVASIPCVLDEFLAQGWDIVQVADGHVRLRRGTEFTTLSESPQRTIDTVRFR